MTNLAWMAMVALALLAGAGLGALLGRGRLRQEFESRALKAEKDWQDQTERAADSLRSAQAKAEKDVADARAQLKARTDKLSAEQRTEVERLTKHLTEAYDELDRLRVRVARASHPAAPDTGQGFAATLPMQDL